MEPKLVLALVRRRPMHVICPELSQDVDSEPSYVNMIRSDQISGFIIIIKVSFYGVYDAMPEPSAAVSYMQCRHPDGVHLCKRTTPIIEISTEKRNLELETE